MRARHSGGSLPVDSIPSLLAGRPFGGPVSSLRPPRPRRVRENGLSFHGCPADDVNSYLLETSADLRGSGNPQKGMTGDCHPVLRRPTPFLHLREPLAGVETASSHPTIGKWYANRP